MLVEEKKASKPELPTVAESVPEGSVVPRTLDSASLSSADRGFGCFITVSSCCRTSESTIRASCFAIAPPARLGSSSPPGVEDAGPLATPTSDTADLKPGLSVVISPLASPDAPIPASSVPFGASSFATIGDGLALTSASSAHLVTAARPSSARGSAISRLVSSPGPGLAVRDARLPKATLLMPG